MADFSHIKEGDVVTRMLAGKLPMKLKVAKVDDRLIHCGGGWTFDRKTGVEEDPDLQWGVEFGATGSYLV